MKFIERYYYKIMNKKQKKLQEEFFNNYFFNLLNLISNIDIKKLIKISNFIEQCIKSKKKIFVAGNGGSAAVANHFLCDFNKGIKISSKNKMLPQVYSLTNSVELITAISNDTNYENIFDFQLENYGSKGDVIFIFSCSGTSKNILNLIKRANQKKIDVIYITGFLKKKLKYELKFHYNLNCKNYGITEDMFSTFMHLISQWIRFKFSNYNTKKIL
jgi:D-sedoheptulose 7-phosphate isomerase